MRGINVNEYILRIETSGNVTHPFNRYNESWNVQERTGVLVSSKGLYWHGFRPRDLQGPQHSFAFFEFLFLDDHIPKIRLQRRPSDITHY